MPGGGGGHILPKGVRLGQSYGDFPVAGLFNGCYVAVHPVQVGADRGVLHPIHGVNHVIRGHVGAIGELNTLADGVDVGQIIGLFPLLCQAGNQLVFLIKGQQALGDLVNNSVGVVVVSKSGVHGRDLGVQADSQSLSASAAGTGGGGGCSGIAAADKADNQQS
ncbi:hypothetical protein SDC9_109394 [bioreactor metagenome]|uniref:Uncharacterized protein n=1 Tax=bioreactor metagenome TaxID=1076179 RepID=A0A645BCZ5_9ZZZZ